MTTISKLVDKILSTVHAIVSLAIIMNRLTIAPCKSVLDSVYRLAVSILHSRISSEQLGRTMSANDHEFLSRVKISRSMHTRTLTSKNLLLETVI